MSPTILVVYLITHSFCFLFGLFTTDDVAHTALSHVLDLGELVLSNFLFESKRTDDVEARDLHLSLWIRDSRVGCEKLARSSIWLTVIFLFGKVLDRSMVLISIICLTSLHRVEKELFLDSTTIREVLMKYGFDPQRGL